MDSLYESDPWASHSNTDDHLANPFQESSNSWSASPSNNNHAPFNDKWNTHNVDELISSNSSIQDRARPISQDFSHYNNSNNNHPNGMQGNDNILAGVNGLSINATNIGSEMWGDSSSLQQDNQNFSTSIHQPIMETNILSDTVNAQPNRKVGRASAGAEEEEEEEEEMEEEFNRWLKLTRRSYNPLYYDSILIDELPKKEGLLFKHTNYLVVHLSTQPIDYNSTSNKPYQRQSRALATENNHVSSGDNNHNDIDNDDDNDDDVLSSRGKVIRRYSDFVWLQSVLLKKYPFRLIPELPQKMIGSQNSDPVFLERRRLGLARFANLVMKHPVLKQDDLVITFLTVPTDLSGWRKNAPYDTTEEFVDKKIDKSFIKMWKPKYASYWNDLEDNLDQSLEYWTKITVLIERFEKRQRAAAQERYMLKQVMSSFSTECTESLYPLDKGGSISDIVTHLGYIGTHLKNCVELTLKENEEIKETLSEKFKSFIEILFSMKGLFERYRILANNSVLQLQRRVELNVEKLNTMKENPDAKGTAYDKLEANIIEDKKNINEQVNRSWLIKECILEEFAIFHETQFVISNLFQKWAQLYSKYADLNSNEWDKLLTNLETIPTSR